MTDLCETCQRNIALLLSTCPKRENLRYESGLRGDCVGSVLAVQNRMNVALSAPTLLAERAQKTSPVPNHPCHSTPPQTQPQRKQGAVIEPLHRRGSVGSVGKLATPAGPARKTDIDSPTVV